jgi:hypothetical protein
VAPTSGGALFVRVLFIALYSACGLPSSLAGGKIQYIEFSFDIQNSVSSIERIQRYIIRQPPVKLSLVKPAPPKPDIQGAGTP